MHDLVQKRVLHRVVVLIFTDRNDLQEKVKAGADLVALGKEAGFEFTQQELETGWEELQESDEGLTDFELDVVAGGNGGSGSTGC